MTQTKHITIIAGEASGDMRAAGLVHSLRQKHPNIYVTGIGGEHMKQAGVDCFADINDLSIIGFSAVLRNYHKIKRLFNKTVDHIKTKVPHAVILVDYPGFNLRLAKEIKKLGIKTVYFISPQLWAWHEQRVEIIKQYVDRMIVLFGFEKEFYDQHGVKVDFVGHPLIDEVQPSKTKEELLTEVELSLDKKTIGLLPGSRKNELERHLPVMLKTCQRMLKKNKHYQFLILQSPTLKERAYTKILNKYMIPAKLVKGQYYNGIAASDFCIVASGTATLETAILNKPMIILYKTTWLNWQLGKRLVKIPYIGLVNIVAGKKVIEEYLQCHAKPNTMAEDIDQIIRDPIKQDRIHQNLLNVKKALGETGASDRAAEVVLDELQCY